MQLVNVETAPFDRQEDPGVEETPGNDAWHIVQVDCQFRPQCAVMLSASETSSREVLPTKSEPGDASTQGPLTGTGFAGIQRGRLFLRQSDGCGVCLSGLDAAFSASACTRHDKIGAAPWSTSVRLRVYEAWRRWGSTSQPRWRASFLVTLRKSPWSLLRWIADLGM